MLPATAENPAPAPEQEEAPDPRAVLDRAERLAPLLEAHAREVLDDFRSDHFRTRRAATDTYLRLALCLADTPPRTDRDIDRLGEWIARLRVETFALQLPPGDWTSLQTGLLNSRPGLLEEYFSLSPQKRIEALQWLIENDTRGLAEPIIADALADSAKYLQFQAVKATLQGRYRSERIVDTLADLAIPQNTRGPQFHIHYWRSDDSSVGSQALQALQAIGSPRQNDRLLELAMKLPSFIPHTRVEDTLVACADRKLLERLRQEINQKQTRTSTLNSGKQRITFSPCDRALMILLRITRQDPKEYGFTSLSSNKPYERYGFADKNKRKAAIQKFNAWWKDHQHEVFNGKDKATPVSQPAPSTAPASAPSTRPKP